MALVTPPMDTKGRFTLRAPWVADSTKIYTVIGLRKFIELVANSVDILNTYYIPNGLTQTEYDADYRAGATLVIIYSSDGAMIFVPDTYINSFPSQSIPAYANYVFSAQVGAFRTDYDFTFAQQKMSEVLSDTLGVEVTVNVDSIGESQVMSVNDAEVLEANRAGAIKDRQTSYAKMLGYEVQIVELKATIKTLQDAYVAKT